jgi:hypothetical protein
MIRDFAGTGLDVLLERRADGVIGALFVGRPLVSVLPGDIRLFGRMIELTILR